MTKPQSRSDATTHPGEPAGAVSAALLVVLGLCGYLVVFFRQPLAEGAGGLSRIDYLMASLVRPDDFVRLWIAGAGWQSLAARLMILGLCAATLCVALAAGWFCLRLLGVDRAVTKLEMTLFSLAVGLNLVSLGTLALGLAGWLHTWAFALPAVAVCLAAAVLYWRAGCASGTANALPPRTTGWSLDRRWLWLAAPFAVAIVLSGMLPPVAFDVREYHLQAPKEFYQQGAIGFLPHNVYANMPLGAELLGLPAMVVLDDWWYGALVGKTLIALFTPLAALALYAAGCRFASPTAGIVAAVVYISIPWLALVSAAGLIEGVFGFYLFMALYAALIWNEYLSRDNDASPRTRWGLLAVAGFTAGAAVATKYPAALYVAVPLVVYVVCRTVATRRCAEARAGWSRIVGPPVVFALAVTLGCGPWLAKNALLSGNPTYPLLGEVFAGQTRTAEKDAQWRRAHRPPNFALGDLARRSWDVLVASRWLSPLVVPLAALAFFSRWRKLAMLLGAYLLFLFAAWWLLTHRIDRFLVPALPLVALLAGLGATFTDRRWWPRTLAALLTLALAFDFVVIAGGPVADNRYLANLGTLRSDPARVDPWHLYFNRRADEVSGLLLVGGAQPFDLDVPTTYNTVFDDSIFEQLASQRSPAQVRLALAERGLSHILVNWPEIARYRSPGNYGIADFLQPEVFDELVSAGVLEELPPQEESASRAYRVLPAAPG